MVMVARPPHLRLDITMDHTLIRGRHTNHQLLHNLLLRIQTARHIPLITPHRRIHRLIMAVVTEAMIPLMVVALVTMLMRDTTKSIMKDQGMAIVTVELTIPVARTTITTMNMKDKITEVHQMDTLKAKVVVTLIIINPIHHNTHRHTIEHLQSNGQLTNNLLTHTHSRNHMLLVTYIRKDLLYRHQLLPLMVPISNTTHINQHQLELQNQKVFTRKKPMTLLEMVL